MNEQDKDMLLFALVAAIGVILYFYLTRKAKAAAPAVAVAPGPPIVATAGPTCG